jgi:hypothetical protein
MRMAKSKAIPAPGHYDVKPSKIIGYGAVKQSRP